MTSGLYTILDTAAGLGAGGPSQTGLILHAEADLRVIKDGLDNVSDWGQLGAGLAQLLQPLLAKQPKWFADIDGKPAILLDGVDDFLKSSSAITIGATFSLFAGLRTLDPDSGRLLIELSVSNNLHSGFFLIPRGGVQTPTIQARQQTGDVISTKQADDSAWCVGTFQRALFEYGGTHATTKLFTNETEEPTTTRNPGVSDEDPDPSTTDDLYVGARAGVDLESNTYLRYLLLYSSILTGDALAQTNSYLAGKW